MLENPKYRMLTGAVLILLLFSLFIWYGNLKPEPEKGNYPGSEELIKDYDQYIGKKADITGEVVDTDPIEIEIEYGDKEKTLKVTEVNDQVEKGDRLSVFGTVKEDNVIEAENSFSVPFLNYVYMYGISLVGASWIFIRIVKQWRWNSEELWFERRDEPVSLKQVIHGGDDDG
ncbi:MAG: hypothetical protein ACOCZJ_00585 [Thermoplasmatota archaeon]